MWNLDDEWVELSSELDFYWLFNGVAKLADAKRKVKWLLSKCHCNHPKRNSENMEKSFQCHLPLFVL